MSRKVRPLPPAELRDRNPEGYARALARHADRLERQRLLDQHRAQAAFAGYRSLGRWHAAGHLPRPASADDLRVARRSAAAARRRLVVPTVWRMPSLEDRGYFRALTGGWRFFPSRSDLPGGAR